MTLQAAVSSMVRRWPIVVMGAVVTVCVMYLAASPAVTYWSRGEVVFLAPSSQRYPNSLQTKSEDLIITAGLVAKRLTGTEPTTKYASVDVNLIGTSSEPEQVWIRLPDTGGQWAPHFNDQVLLLEVRAETPQRVEQLYAAAVAAIRHDLATLQRIQRVPAVDHITITSAPQAPVVYAVTGRRSRAVGMAALLGVGLTIVAVAGLERRGYPEPPRGYRPFPRPVIPPRHRARRHPWTTPTMRP